MNERIKAYLLPKDLGFLIRGVLNESGKVVVGRTTSWANYVTSEGPLVNYEFEMPKIGEELESDPAEKSQAKSAKYLREPI